MAENTTFENSVIYPQWNASRIKYIEEKFGVDWFDGKTVLELGCGSGAIGCHLVDLGAEVTFSDARAEFLDKIHQVRPENTLVLADLNTEWPFEPHYDLIIHFGLLYHLMNPEQSIMLSVKSCDFLLLESKLIQPGPADAQPVLYEEDTRFDSAYNLQGTKFNRGWVENILIKQNVKFERYDGSELNVSHSSNRHITYGGDRDLWYGDCR